MPVGQDFKHDVFLSHNSGSKDLARALKDRLVAKGVRVWFDDEELPPGIPWQPMVEAGIRDSRSVAVLVGQDGLGPWEDQEMQAALSEAVGTGRPVIPVLLPGAPQPPKLPMFLRTRGWVNMRDGITDEAMAKLVWGIKGVKPEPTTAKAAGPLAGVGGCRFRCKLSCRDKVLDAFHTRPAGFLKQLCDQFPNTTFRISKAANRGENEVGNPKSVMSMLFGCFQHGDELILEVEGELEMKAGTFVKIALENMEGYCDDVPGTEKRVADLIDKANEVMFDPELDMIEERLMRARNELPVKERENRFVAVINDRLHDVSLPMIPLIAKHFGCDFHISFDVPPDGIYSFAIEAKNGYALDRRILDLDISVGTKITILAAGDQGKEAGAALKNVLQSLWQCDAWIRRHRKDIESPQAITELLVYARESGRRGAGGYGYIQNPFVSNLIARNSVFVNPPGQNFSKEEALIQLARAHAEHHGLRVDEIVKAILETEQKQTVRPRPGFAIAHTAIENGPRISISFGTYAEGVFWSKLDGNVNLVAMVIFALDARRTWLDYMQRFGKLFHELPQLQNQLMACRSPNEFTALFRQAEISLAKC